MYGSYRRCFTAPKWGTGPSLSLCSQPNSGVIQGAGRVRTMPARKKVKILPSPLSPPPPSSPWERGRSDRGFDRGPRGPGLGLLSPSPSPSITNFNFLFCRRNPPGKGKQFPATGTWSRDIRLLVLGFYFYQARFSTTVSASTRRLAENNFSLSLLSKDPCLGKEEAAESMPSPCTRLRSCSIPTCKHISHLSDTFPDKRQLVC
ncbi:hypothetical protein QBC39DRAFT_158264 [Podospora conica]|nr:hypothetical protein QBC39DRAFT_158264 [Schizothecium conicum]